MMTNLPIFNCFWCDIDGVELLLNNGIILHGVTGRGKTLSAAKKDYAKELSGKLIIIDAHLNTQREMQLPEITSSFRSRFEKRSKDEH